jgi:hypothetical protein
MINEYDLVLSNGTWNLVDCLHDINTIDCKWVYRVKYKPNGKIDKYKERLVAKGFSQQEGIYYEETFAATSKWNTIGMVINLVAHNGWKLHQMDVKISFLNGDLKEYIFTTQPQGFEAKGQEHKFCKRVKDLHGLKQAPQSWYAKMDEYLRKVGFQRSESNDTLYFRIQDKNTVILVLNC